MFSLSFAREKLGSVSLKKQRGVAAVAEGQAVHLGGRRFACLLGVVFLVARLGDVMAAEPNWGTGTSEYVVVDQDLKAVLSEISHHLGLPAHISDEIKGRVREKMTAGSDKELIRQLSDRYGFTWYFDGSSIYFSALKENVSQIFPIGQVTPSSFQQELEKLSILDRRFELRYSDSGRIVYAAGPPRYVELVRQALEAANAQTVVKLQNRNINVIYGYGGTQ